MQCTQCHAEFQDGAKFCPHCGHPAAAAVAPVLAPTLACAACQAPLKPEAKFCNHCGAAVARAPMAAQPVAVPPAPPAPEPAPIKEAVSAGKEPKNEGNYPLPPLFPAEPATNMGNNVGLWIGGAIAFFAAIGGAVYLFMDNSPSPLKNKVGPMEVPAVSAPAPVMNAPTEPVAPALVTDSAPLNTPLAVAPQPVMVPDVPLPPSPEAPAQAEAKPVKRPVEQPKPVVRPVTREAPAPEPAPVPTPAPAPVAAVKSCGQASFLMRPVCVLEGPATFWRCTPDGKRWNNDLPGCHRNDN